MEPQRSDYRGRVPNYCTVLRKDEKGEGFFFPEASFSHTTGLMFKKPNFVLK